jgi:hypothetical protein
MRIFHGASAALVLGDPQGEGGVVVGHAVEDLGGGKYGGGGTKRAYAICVEVSGSDGLGAGVGGVGKGHGGAERGGRG